MKLVASNIEHQDTKAPVECFCMSIENWQLFEFIITCWDSISYTSLVGLSLEI